jgi:hypothetical protein
MPRVVTSNTGVKFFNYTAFLLITLEMKGSLARRLRVRDVTFTGLAEAGSAHVLRPLLVAACRPEAADIRAEVDGDTTLALAEDSRIVAQRLLVAEAETRMAALKEAATQRIQAAQVRIEEAKADAAVEMARIEVRVKEADAKASERGAKARGVRLEQEERCAARRLQADTREHVGRARPPPGVASDGPVPLRGAALRQLKDLPEPEDYDAACRVLAYRRAGYPDQAMPTSRNEAAQWYLEACRAQLAENLHGAVAVGSYREIALSAPGQMSVTPPHRVSPGACRPFYRAHSGEQPPFFTTATTNIRKKRRAGE